MTEQGEIATDELSLLNWLDRLEPRLRDELMEGTKVRALRKDEFLWQPGDPATHLFQVQHGHLSMFTTSAQGSELLYLIYGPGECLGDRSCIAASMRRSVVKARDDCSVRLLPYERYAKFATVHPEINRQMLQNYSNIILILYQYLAVVGLSEMPVQIAYRLLNILKISFPRRETQGYRNIVLPLTQAELASMLSVSRQTVSKVLKQWEEEAIIECRYGQLTICEPEYLQSIVESELGTAGFP